MTLTIRNHRLVGPGVSYVPANAMGGPITPSLIVLHDTAGRIDRGSSVAWFRSKTCKTSAHIVVERDGTIVQMVPFDRKAFHAGESVWAGKRYCNSFAIGIEIVGPGKLDRDGAAWFGQAVPPGTPLEYHHTVDHGAGWWLPYTPAQIAAVERLCRALMVAYEDVNDITTHWEVSPGRKIDPGPHFPLARVRAFAEGRADDDDRDDAADVADARDMGAAVRERTPPASMLQSTTAQAATAIGTGGAATVATEMSAAAKLVAAAGGEPTLLTVVLALAQSPTFWIGAGTIVLAAYVWLERRAKLIRYGI